MRIGITYNLKTDLSEFEASLLPEDAVEEFDLPETLEAIKQVFEESGHEVFLLGGDLEVIEQINRFGVEFVFNIAEGFHGRNREAQIPAILELMEIPYSGSDPLGLTVTLDKSLAKRMAISLGIPTPEFWLAEGLEDLRGGPRRFPLFVKPLWEGSSKGIRRTSRVENKDELEREISRLLNDYSEQPILIETYVPGREMTVGVIGNQNAKIIGMMEIAFKDSGEKDFCYSLETKRNWKELVEYHYPVSIDARIKGEIGDSALRLFKALRLRDFARFDFRVDLEGKYYFLEANPLAGLSPESGDLVILAKKKGWSYRELILKITDAAWSRYPLSNRGSI